MFARALIIHIAALSLAGCWSFSPVNGFCQLSKISRQVLVINSTINRYMLLLSHQGISGYGETFVAYFFQCYTFYHSFDINHRKWASEYWHPCRLQHITDDMTEYMWVKHGGGLLDGLPSMLERGCESKEENVVPHRSAVMSWGKDVGGAWNCSASSELIIDRLWQHNLSVMVLSPQSVISCVMVLGLGLFIPVLFCSSFPMCHVLHYISCFYSCPTIAVFLPLLFPSVSYYYHSLILKYIVLFYHWPLCSLGFPHLPFKKKKNPFYICLFSF